MSTYPNDHPHYQTLERVLKLHLEKYGEPWERRGPLIQDILNELFIAQNDLRKNYIYSIHLLKILGYWTMIALLILSLH